MKIEQLDIAAVKILTPKRFFDSRGYFCETWNRRVAANAGIKIDFVQDNHSFSKEIGTVRGLHCQAPPFAQDKLVRVVKGRIFDVAVDIRRGSDTYGQWVGCELSAENAKQIFVPKGFLHGFSTLEENTEVIYKCSDFYDPSSEISVSFDDATLNIEWKLGQSSAKLSEKDEKAISFNDLVSPFESEDR